MENERVRSSYIEQDRRAFLAQFGKLALIAPPAVTMLLSTSMSSPAIARSSGAPKGNNGLGNGYDPQPPGNPKVNDGEGSGPGSPGNKGGNEKAATDQTRNRPKGGKLGH